METATPNILDVLFKFPIVMVDGDREEQKEKLDGILGNDDVEVDIIIGEAECPYYDFLSISDRWLPTNDSYNKALAQDFDACFVTFGSSGSFVVPWTKTRFKKELKEFMKKQ